MSLIFLILVQWLHILTGIAWFGGHIFMDFVVWPALLRRPGTEAKPLSDLLPRFARPLMATSGTLVILMGIVRGTLLGPIKSLSALFTTAYGLTWLVALIIALALTIWGAGWHARLIGPVWKEDHIRPGVVSRLRAGIIFEMICFAAILACMVLMGVGL